jgi:uncharacterized protein YciI
MESLPLWSWTGLPGATSPTNLDPVPQTLEVLFYTYGDDAVTRRVPLRPAHLELIQAYHGDGRLLQAGAYGDPPKGGLLVFAGAEAAEAFVSEDPYVQKGLVERWSIEPWNVVTG